MDTINKVFDFIENEDLIKSGEKILVGVSGGPDSILLLDILYKLKDKLDISIVAAHINHMLRGMEADGDEKFVEAFCNERNIPFYSKKINIKQISERLKESAETVGRNERYKFFDEIYTCEQCNKVATAHNANDQVETVLMRIMRGTGLEGLTGIPVKRNEKYIRPILFLNRDEIEEYCSWCNLNPRVDKSNEERDYSRNKVRLDIIPYMVQNFNGDIINTVNRMIHTLNEDKELIESIILNKYNEYVEEENYEVKISNKLLSEKSSIVSRVLRKSIQKIEGSSYNVELKHIEDIKKLFLLGTNKKINLPNNIIAENIYGNIIISKNIKKDIVSSNEVVLQKNLLRNVKFNCWDISFELIEGEKKLKFNNNKYIKYFNYDKINDSIIIRNRKDGDRIIPMGMKGSKKVKDIFIDCKVPVENRDNIPLVSFDNNIAWVVGYKLSELYKITNDTEKLLKITIKERK